MPLQFCEKSQEVYDDSIEDSDSYGSYVREVTIYGWISDFDLEVLKKVLDDSSSQQDNGAEEVGEKDVTE